MRIISNLNQPNTKQNTAFTAKVVITPAAKKILEKNYLPSSFDGLTFDQVFGTYKSLLEQATSDIGGKIKLHFSKKSKSGIKLTYTCAAIDYKCSERHHLEDFPIFPMQDNLMKASVEKVIARIGDTVSVKNLGYGERNPFATALRKMIYEEKD